MKAEITVGACWDGGNYYGPEYVNRLYAACCRNIKIPFIFVLYCGPDVYLRNRVKELHPDIHAINIGLPYWWSGMMFWSPDPPGIPTDKILYLDLDQVIVANLDEIINYPSEHCGMKDYPAARCPAGLEKDICVSTTLIRKGVAAKVWQIYVDAGSPVYDPIHPPVKAPLTMAAQGIINDPNNNIIHDYFPETWIASYKNQVRGRGLPSDCKIVSFHGRPKMHEVKEVFINKHWIDNSTVCDCDNSDSCPDANTTGWCSNNRKDR